MTKDIHIPEVRSKKNLYFVLQKSLSNFRKILYGVAVLLKMISKLSVQILKNLQAWSDYPIDQSSWHFLCWDHQTSTFKPSTDGTDSSNQTSTINTFYW